MNDLKLNINTHIMGRAGSGKTYFISKLAIELTKKDSPFIYISTFDDFGELSPPTAKFTLDTEPVVKEILRHIASKESVSIYIPKGVIGPEAAREIMKELIQEIIGNYKVLENYTLFLDEAQNIDNESLIKVLENSNTNNYSVYLSHQYLEQLSEELEKTIMNICKQYVYFRIAAVDLDKIILQFQDDVDQVTHIQNLKESEYAILTK